MLLPWAPSAAPRLSWAERVRRRDARQRRAEAGLPPDPDLEEPSEIRMEAWYGKKKRRIGSQPVDWDEEVPEPPDPDLG